MPPRRRTDRSMSLTGNLPMFPACSGSSLHFGLPPRHTRSRQNMSWRQPSTPRASGRRGSHTNVLAAQSFRGETPPRLPARTSPRVDPAETPAILEHLESTTSLAAAAQRHRPNPRSKFAWQRSSRSFPQIAPEEPSAEHLASPVPAAPPPKPPEFLSFRRRRDPLVFRGSTLSRRGTRTLRICTAKSHYAAVRECSRALGFHDVHQRIDVRSWREKQDEQPDVTWSDKAVAEGTVMRLMDHQKINHFPGMIKLCRKQTMARCVRQWNEHAGAQDAVSMPITWLLPAELELMTEYCNAQNDTVTVIVKPDAGSQGKGIFLSAGPPSRHHLGRKAVAQQYIDNPLLLDGRKFDIRLYVLVSHVDPLRVWMFEDGLIRLCTDEYEPPSPSNFKNAFMHLTNYSINKRNESFDRSEAPQGEEGATGSKRSLLWLMRYLSENLHCDVSRLWQDMGQLVAHTLISVLPELCNTYRRCAPKQPPGAPCRCFEVLGFDLLLDEQLRPWLLEVNHSPSFRCEAEIDQNIKGRVIQGALVICQLPHPEQATLEDGYVSGHCRAQPVVVEGWHWIGEWWSSSDPSQDDAATDSEGDVR